MYTNLNKRHASTSTNTSEIRAFTGDRPLRACIVGSGPAGMYCAKYLLRDSPVDVTVDVYEAMYAPFGLVRYGVAPDHPEVKAVQNDFASVMEDERCSFMGNVRIGADVTPDELSSAYDVVVLAYGAGSERHLNVPNEELKGVLPARHFVNWYNGHPDFVDLSPDLSTDTAVVVG
jgi:NADPH-dependent glutamate synthase beta subunit-like oxidoreductase